jgi:hypothetical protein
MGSYLNRLYRRLSVNLDEGTTTVQLGLIAGGVAMAMLLTLMLLGRMTH